MKKFTAFFIACILSVSLTACGTQNMGTPSDSANSRTEASNMESSNQTTENTTDITVPENFVRITGGTFQMGSPESEAWRSADEIQHTVTVRDFYMSAYEVSQKEYQEMIGANPSNFKGDDLPVETVSWLDAIRFCNAYSEKENLTPVYIIDGNTVSWDRSANGYRLPTEAEWEYACRAGTTTPFNTESSISAEEANY